MNVTDEMVEAAIIAWSGCGLHDMEGCMKAALRSALDAAPTTAGQRVLSAARSVSKAAAEFWPEDPDAMNEALDELWNALEEFDKNG
jgi:hypothetical protein